jgi:type IV pilus assembly protein PilC
VPKYTYSALAADGSTVTGLESADNTRALHEELLQRDLHPVEIREKRSIWQFEITKERVKKRDLMHFSRQLAVFVKAGIPILEGLEAISEEAASKALRRTLDDLGTKLRGGARFADAAAEHPEMFPSYYVSVLRSAELTGNLDGVLVQLAEYIERDMDTRKKVSSALFYPAIILGLGVVVVIIMMTFVLPRLTDFFDSFDAELPLSTRILIAVANLSGEWGLLVAGVLVLLLGGFMLWTRTSRGRTVYDRMLLRIPGLGDVVRHAIIERFCRVLSNMVSAGVPIPDALAVTGDVTNNRVFRDRLAIAREAMVRGEGLARPLAETGLFPGAARQMFRVGEVTGTLDQQLETAARYFDRELEFKLKRFTSMFEPAVIVVIGLGVGFVAVAMVSAIYGVYNQVEF